MDNSMEERVTVKHLFSIMWDQRDRVFLMCEPRLYPSHKGTGRLRDGAASRLTHTSMEHFLQVQTLRPVEGVEPLSLSLCE